MAGYIGSKVAVTQVDGYTKSEADARYVEGDDTLYVDQTNNRVGVGTTSPTSAIHAVGGAGTNIAIQSTAGNHWRLGDAVGSSNSTFVLYDYTNSAVRLSVDNSGNFAVSKSSVGAATAGFETRSSGYTAITRDGGQPLEVRRLTSDGQLIDLRKDSTSVGGIGTASSYLFIGGSSNGKGIKFIGNAVQPCNNAGADNDNDQDLGGSSARWDDIYAANGTIQTSDRNEKQDIAELTEAEQRVAIAAKGLLRKFRWKSAVAEKGEAARTHFGIIAQDLQAAFEAEGLDAGDYAMFISSTWWETQTEVPAVKAVAEVLDDDGNVVTEAVEAVDAYTRIDTYDTAEEAPEGATQRTRLGVRYPELLAFIIGAL